MKRIIAVLLLLVSGTVYAQKIPGYGFDKVHINLADKIINADIIPVTSEPKLKSDLFYYWYSANAIHSTQGGFSGQLLNGQYTEFYINKNLKEQGNFNKGLKDGTWKNWKEDGTINTVTSWKNGVPVTGNDVSFWQKLNPFRSKKNRSDAVAPNKSN